MGVPVPLGPDGGRDRGAAPARRPRGTRGGRYVSWVKDRQVAIGAVLVFLISQVVYLMTLTRACPFWDSGEFIATSYILGIPHPPGTPFYVLIGRVFTLFPIGEIAMRVNYLSALSTSIAVLFAYLLTVEIFRWQQRGRSDPAPIEIGILAGIAAGLFTAFSRTLWENAVEAEVYGLSGAVVMASLWLAVKWAGEEGTTQRDNRLFVLIYYLIAVSAGIHMGTYLVLPAVILFVLMVDHRTFAPNWLGAFVIAGVLLGLQPAMLPTLKTGWLILLGLGIVGSLLLGKVWSPLGPRGVVFWCLLLGLIGLSNHLYLPIRAALDPAINEADPASWDALWLALIRDQYKPANPFLYRNAPFDVQFVKHFWRYAHDQYELGFRPLWLARYLPYGIALLGLIAHARREKKTFLMLFSFYLVTSIGLVFYLNFREDEVRDRDYFFSMSYQVVAIWIGLGFGTLATWVRWAYGEGKDRLGNGLGVAMGLLGCFLAFSTMANFWHIRDRSGFYLARDLAYNMLKPLKENALIFTNGDNDTFPLWYIQEVEKFRKDVRVLNLSLLNTDWYMRQVRDYEPDVDLGWTDEQIEAATLVPEAYAQYRQGFLSRDRYVRFLRENGLAPYVANPDEFTYAKDIVSRRIIEREYEDGRPIYFAVTVPDQIGYTDRLTMEGLVFRLGESNPGGGDRVDIETTLHNLDEVYLYRGLLKEDGTHDESVYKNRSAQKLVQNYAAGYIRVAEEVLEDWAAETDEARKKDLWDRAIQATDQALELSGSSTILYSCGVIYYRAEAFARAEETFRTLWEHGHDEYQILRILGRAVERQGRIADAERIYWEGFNLYPDDQEALRELFSFYFELDRREEAIDVLEAWVQRHPADEAARRRLAELKDSL
ncbi:MAG: DUF2723 domain-containing protein [Candidatus Eisenbacteria bacterium]|nr:DUF2723 domain-containing protein [Candidatus Latescibacterota bacterium]MBD3302293.1 DUF2723 domain-containing protein [Candidatus Eisenbacteria bacterium]